MRQWIGPAAWAGRQAKAGDRLPYARHVGEHIVALRDGALMAMIQVPGLPSGSGDGDAPDRQDIVRETLMRHVLDGRFIVHHHIVRRRVAVSLGQSFANPFAALLNDRWQARLDERRLFVNEQVVTLLRRPPRGRTGIAGRLRRRDTQADPAELRALDAAAVALVAALQPDGGRLLATYDGPSGTCSEPLELLSAIYNGEMRPVRLPDAAADLGHHLPYARVSFGLDAIEVRSPGERGFAAMLSVRDYPDATRPALIDGILRLPHELVLAESFAPGAGQAGFQDHHLGLMVRADSLPTLDEAVAGTAAMLADLGAVAVREDVNLEPCFWGQFPGNEGLVRRTPVSGARAAGCLSLGGPSIGRAAGTGWGEAVTAFETAAATPYFFNFHAGEDDLGHFAIIGPPGSGRTVVTNFLVAQAQRFAPRTILFDRDRSAEICLRACGGSYHRLMPGEPSGLNPLQLPDTPANRAFLRDWLGVLLQTDGTDEQAAIAAAIDAAYDADPAFRRLRYLRELLGGRRRPRPGDLAQRLEPWIGAGEHAWLFDNAADILACDVATLGVDVSALLDRPALRTPAMMVLLHRTAERLTGEPAMILLDEGWTVLDDPVFAGRLDTWLTRLRSRNAVVGFTTRSARDALASRVAAPLLEQTATMIFTRNPKAQAEDYCHGFGLSAHELELIRRLPAHGCSFLVRQAGRSVVARLDLAGMPDVLTVLSGREASVRRLDRLRAEVGDEPSRWYPLLTGQPWPGEGDDLSWAEAAE